MLDSIRDPLRELMEGPEARVVIGITIVLIASAICAYVALKLRDRAGQGTPSSGEHLASFRQMYEDGTMREFEYRRVKSDLSSNIQQELTSDENDSEGPVK